MNKLFITDLHVEYRDFQTLFSNDWKKQLFERLESWLFLYDDNKAVSLYLGWDFFSYIAYDVSQNLFVNCLAHLYLIKEFLKERKLVLENVYYVFWNHEFYLDTEKDYLNIFRYLWLEFKNHKTDLQKKFIKLLEDKGFKINNYLEYPKELQVLDKPETYKTMDVVDYLYKFAFAIIFPEVELHKVDKSSFVLPNNTVLLWCTLFAPYLWKFNKEISIGELCGLGAINDKHFLFQNLKSGAITELSEFERFEWWFDLLWESLPQCEPLIETFEWLRKYLIKTQTCTLRDFYCASYYLFLYNFLHLLWKINNISKDKNLKIEHIEILTHFPFDVFDDKFTKQYKLMHDIEIEIFEKIDNYKKNLISSYFNVSSKALEMIMWIINKEKMPNIKTVTFYCWHTHLPHTTKWEHDWIKYMMINRYE